MSSEKLKFDFSRIMNRHGEWIVFDYPQREEDETKHKKPWSDATSFVLRFWFLKNEKMAVLLFSTSKEESFRTHFLWLFQFNFVLI